MWVFALCVLCMCCCIFFFKQKTAYEMRISDWSSDVCSSDLFTETSLPAGLRKDHCTKPGVWGLIQVAEGRLRYCVTDLRRVGVDLVLTPESRPGVVEPTILHHVVPLGTVRFHVQFDRQIPDATPICRYENMDTRENKIEKT